MEKVDLNLTRKWRSKNFQEIVGQPLAVRILQNSLYLKQYFPVYLFAGQRGCGKTSTARIFAAAINCERLSDFQTDPRKFSIPCLLCQSCIAMSTSQHPDFIEIDAASHTGVDNVRNIIDASSFLPLMGSKKIYLIDEAHMLSKAAFNAFLKILEEPPASVVFILATTDMQKILDTVRSRCFQIFFDPVEHQVIADHLEKLCVAENIFFDQDALLLIAQESGGSVRDAINLLEQVRFSTKKVSKQAVLSVLGHIDEVTLCALLEKILQADIHELLTFCTTLEKYEFSIEYIYKQLLELVYDAILIRYHVQPSQFCNLSAEYKNMIMQVDMQRLTSLFALLCSQEQNIYKTTKKLRYFEMILLQNIWQQPGSQESKKKNNVNIVESVLDPVPTVALPQQIWKNFVMGMQSFHDLVLITMLQEAIFLEFDQQKSIVKISFLKKFTFFKDVVEQTRPDWSIILQKYFGHNAQLHFDFESTVSKPVSENGVMQSSVQSRPVMRPESRVAGDKLDLSDASKWKISHELMKHFDGIITEISGDIYG